MTKEERDKINDLAVVVSRIDERTLNIQKYIDEDKKRQDKCIADAQATADEAKAIADTTQTQLSTIKWVGGFIAALLGALGGWFSRS
jgi:hypothetical protein